MEKQVFRNIAIASIVVLVALTSCNKEDEIRDPLVLLEKYSRIARHSNSSYMEFKYDKKNRITKRLTYKYGYGELLSLTETLTYNNKGDLVNYEVIESDLNIKVEFLKNDNKVSFEWVNGLFIEIELNSQGLPVKITKYINDEGEIFELESTVYEWEKGNLIQKDLRYYIEEYGYNAIFTYDNMKSPFYNCETPKWFLLYWLGNAHCSMNNVETILYSWNPSSVIISEKTYNDKGFIASRRGWDVLIADGFYYIVK